MTAQKPTVVLVHGAFADSSSWNGVVEKLQSHDYPVIAASNPLRGLTNDAEYVRQVVAAVDGPVVLAGHSYGGSVISNAARGLDNVKALVFVAAFLPDEGESAIDLSGKFPGSTLGAALRPAPVTLPDGSQVADLYIDKEKFHDQFAADVPEATTSVMAATQRPVTDAALGEGAATPAWKEIPSWVLVATQDQNIPPQTQKFMAQRAKATQVEVEASHAVSVSQPGEVARLINTAATAVA
ncbi:alpha/beta hydrolase [Streptomyces sp. ADI93-02]|uniref:alpha/beta fold hydrolase n=1 Tax=Streptomyces sp. ADI93-02 TaxID=1522757 RepID=UPI000F558158|nr:alpha/beta hydrolase [Streptomyces sp. ADI93-02]RPK32229.1 short chain dehydrogenase [Streptomyces sp. ADI93-02]